MRPPSKCAAGAATVTVRHSAFALGYGSASFFYARLPEVFPLVQSFSPRCDGGEPAFIFDALYGPAIDLWNLCYAGPRIDIYRVP